MGRAALSVRLTPVLLLGLAWLVSLPASAQTRRGGRPSQGLVVRDGTLGNAPPGVVGPGTDPLGRPATYLIPPELGEQHGANLFHSFLRFSIARRETATFTGPDPIDGPQSVTNVIARVTGDDPSQIDGRLRSTIPGAGLWLLNPQGVVFGAGAKLDVQGSFHAGTGDYVDFGEGELVRFYGDPSRESVLATAPPAAFGFLPATAHAAPLAVDGSTLEVSEGETLELVGRGLSVPDAEPGLSLTGAKPLAPGGHVALEAQGGVALSHSLVDVGREGDTPGSISIRGGQIVIEEGSQVLAENESPVSRRGGRKGPRPVTPGPGSISVEASESVLVDDSLLSVSTNGAGNAGTIRVDSLGEDRPRRDVDIRKGP